MFFNPRAIGENGENSNKLAVEVLWCILQTSPICPEKTVRLGSGWVPVMLIPQTKTPNLASLLKGLAMPAIETFDWLKKELWPTAQNDLRLYLEEKRKYLLNIRNENERRRFVDEILLEVRSLVGVKKS